jgi:hypothetical protein
LSGFGQVRVDWGKQLAIERFFNRAGRRRERESGNRWGRRAERVN